MTLMRRARVAQLTLLGTAALAAAPALADLELDLIPDVATVAAVRGGHRPHLSALSVASFTTGCILRGV